jgi:hypothetical protein
MDGTYYLAVLAIVRNGVWTEYMQTCAAYQNEDMVPEQERFLSDAHEKFAGAYIAFESGDADRAVTRMNEAMPLLAQAHMHNRVGGDEKGMDVTWNLWVLANEWVKQVVGT